MKRILSILLALVMVIGMLPMTLLTASAATTEIVFQLGDDGTASHVDGSKNLASYSETVGDYTLNITGGTNMYPSSRDAKGNGCIKLGSSKNTGSFTFTVPDDVTSVVIAIAKYKANTTKVSVNGTDYTLTNASNNGAYDDIDVDTTATKTVTVTTVSGGVRAMVNSITFICSNGSDTEDTTPACEHNYTSVVTDPTCTESGYTTFTCSLCEDSYVSDWVDALGHSYGDWVVDPAATCTEAGQQTQTCATCGDVQTEVIAATGHSYDGASCSVCGAETPDAVATLITSADQLISGNYILMVSSGYAMGAYDSGWVTAVKPAMSDGKIVDAAGGIWTLTVDGTSVVIKDANGVFIAPKAGNNNGVIEGEYSWAWSVNEDGTFVFAGTGDDTTKLASNTTSENKFRAYKNATVEGNATSYLANFAVYKIIEGGEPACEHTNTTVVGQVDATCTTVGSTGTVICSDCGATVTEATEIPVVDHNYVNGICSVCGKEFETEPDIPDEEGSYVKATSVSAGDTIIIVSEQAGMELSSFSTTSTVYGIGTAYTDIPAGTMTWTVEEGTVAGSYAFKNADGNYLYWSSGNSLKTSATKDAQSSWNVTFDGNDVILVIAGTSDVARHIAWNSGSPRFANYKDSTISGQTTYYTIQFYKYQTGGACEHSWGEWVTTAAPTCTATGIQTATCSLCGDTKTQSIAATGHTYTYTETAITCANCDYSATYTLSTIAEAKAYTDTTAVYYVKGIVTYVSNDKVYIEDTTGGILVMFTSADAASGIVLGDEILVWDCLTTYNGLIETTYTLASEYLKVSSGNALPSQTVTIADLLADTTNEYLAERVVIEGVTVGTINTSGNTALTDANGNTINIYKVSGLAENINENDTVIVTAIVSTYNGYQLLVNPGTAATDVVETAAGEEEVVTTVTIAEAKAGTAGEYYQVEGTVTYVSGRNVYIQDATGGIVVYLTANAASTQVGDNVKAYGALKVYNGLIELDAVDETNADFYSIMSSGNTVEAQQTSIAGLLADTTNEYLAEKVVLHNVYVSYYSYSSSYGNVTYTLTDGNGNTIQIYRVTVASEEECVAKGSIVNVEAIVSTYNGYQLVTTNDKITVTGTCAHETTQLVNYTAPTCTEGGYTGDTECVICGVWTARGEDSAALGHNYNANGVCDNNCGISPKILMNGAYYASFEDANAAFDGHPMKLLANIGEDGAVKLTQNIYVDLFGFTMNAYAADANGYTIFGMDSTTDSYEAEEWGYLTVTGTATVAPVTNNCYLAVDEGELGWSFHAFSVKLTHVSLQPGADALGYKAELKGDEYVQSAVLAYGFEMGVSGGVSQTYTKNGQIDDGVFSLRLQGIMAANGGEMEINAVAFVTFDGAGQIKSDAHSTTMKKTIEYINDNWADFDTDKQAAVTAYVADNYEAMKSWNIANIYVPETEEVPAA